MKFITGILLIVLVQEAVSQIIYDGQCPKIDNPLEHTFDFNKFIGVWIGVERYPFPTIFKCTRGFYRNNYNGTYVVYDTGLDVNTGKPISAIYKARIFKGPNLAISFFPGQSIDKVNFIVVGTDYKSWAAISACSNISKTQYAKIANILARKYPLNKKDLKKAYAALKHAQVDLSKLIDYDQKNCTY